MFYLSMAFVVYVIASLWYIHKLHKRIRSYEEEWIHIEELTDHNEDGDVVLHCRHMEK